MQPMTFLISWQIINIRRRIEIISEIDDMPKETQTFCKISKIASLEPNWEDSWYWHFRVRASPRARLRRVWISLIIDWHDWHQPLKEWSELTYNVHNQSQSMLHKDKAWVVETFHIYRFNFRISFFPWGPFLGPSPSSFTSGLLFCLYVDWLGGRKTWEQAGFISIWSDRVWSITYLYLWPPTHTSHHQRRLYDPIIPIEIEQWRAVCFLYL